MHTVYLHTASEHPTYKNPFPQPRGPKKSSVGRQTFRHTPLRLGQDQGKDAASFSTTVMMRYYFSDVSFQILSTVKELNMLHVTCGSRKMSEAKDAELLY